MRMLAGLIAMAALGATAASAAPSHLSDSAYLQAARCVGLASSGKLAVSDGKQMAAWLRSQSGGRPPFILDKADQLERQAKREAAHAGDSAKVSLNAELQGACAQLKS
jgi:hypothetical protein